MLYLQYKILENIKKPIQKGMFHKLTNFLMN